ncbi:Protein YidD [Nitrincola lacisaponensis]|uniref:Putative membrane protein insertion efficiency factor n=1 Tax=Nitrincola lacisaponensis TaxID=267850 RepID=A0A063Y3Y1_9GAMM|nr:membrane protein insertion efficiency factor YidD [Nitrincola lacisaponensis]KDE40998.1 Protein YidD [Nitrincola lacisaponensis]
MSWLRRQLGRVLILLVKFYQYFISPMLPPSCRYEPTCSAYMIEAIQVHGPLKGLYLGIRRVLRCHPLREGGYDPVPPKCGCSVPCDQEKKAEK